MATLSTYLQMGGYAGFIWSAFAITLLVMAALLVASLRSLRARESALTALQGEAPRAGGTETAGEA
ncbi:MAG: heme exporter protein CcmD [Rhodospirillales bacterium]